MSRETSPHQKALEILENGNMRQLTSPVVFPSRPKDAPDASPTTDSIHAAYLSSTENHNGTTYNWKRWAVRERDSIGSSG